MQPLAGFVYQEVALRRQQGRPQAIDIRLEPQKGRRGKCSQCQRPAPGYDRLEERSWLHVPLWGIPTYFFYAPRRVECPGARGGGGGDSLEPRQRAGDPDNDGIASPIWISGRPFTPSLSFPRLPSERLLP